MTQDLSRDRHVFGSHERSNRLSVSVFRYAIAILATLIAFAATFALRHGWQTPIWLFSVLAVAISAWYGGRGPSILSAALSTFLVQSYIRNPVGSFRINGVAELISILVFLTVAVMISGTIEALLRSRALAESRAAELERVNEELRHALVSRRLLAAQETERRRIARVLHEDVGQLLTALRMNLQRLTRQDGGEGSVVGDSIGLVDETLTHVRALSVELRPTVLDDLGLGEAVAWYANRQAERAGYAVVVEQALGAGRLPEAIETAGFRIVQQALTNIARHARAKSVRVVLRRDVRTVEITVVDDGIGFDVGNARARSQAGDSLGLVHMNELAYLAGGILTLTSSEARGTTVRVQFPVDSVE